MIHTSMFQKHIHKVKFYPSADDFTQAPLVMLVTNIMSAYMLGLANVDSRKCTRYEDVHIVIMIVIMIIIMIVMMIIIMFVIVIRIS